ncbi:MAG: oxidoreductase, partial [Alphaproteobacteria bacterium]|nr:oxidoreductase [Alphaproteobacteria bacterium]
LVALAHDKSRILMVGHLLQYHPAFLTLRSMVRDGRLGRLQYLYSNRLNLGKVRREENILWSFAPHDLSMILSLVGALPETVSATGSYYLHRTIADVTTTQMSFPGGQSAHVFVSWLHPYKEQKLVVVGDQGMAVFDDGEPWDSKLSLYPHRIEWREGMPVPNKADREPVPLDQDEPLKLECAHFLECIVTRRTPRTDGAEGVAVLRVLDAAERSMTSGHPVSLTTSGDDVFVHDTARVDRPSTIGAGTKIWHYSHVLSGSTLGAGCVVGQNVSIGPDVKIGSDCKIQNNVSVYKGVTLEDGVFCGPSCVFTNVRNPRAEVNRRDEFSPTMVRRGATIGANATIVCGTELGPYCMIGAGAVVTHDVPAFALVAGVPARRIGWVSHTGDRLGADLICPRSGRRYRENKPDKLEEIVLQAAET